LSSEHVCALSYRKQYADKKRLSDILIFVCSGSLAQAARPLHPAIVQDSLSKQPLEDATCPVKITDGTVLRRFGQWKKGVCPSATSPRQIMLW